MGSRNSTPGGRAMTICPRPNSSVVPCVQSAFVRRAQSAREAHAAFQSGPCRALVRKVLDVVEHEHSHVEVFHQPFGGCRDAQLDYHAATLSGQFDLTR